MVLPRPRGHYYPQEFEEAKARLAERRQRLEGGTVQPSARTRRLVGLLFAGFAVAVMAFAVLRLIGFVG